MVYEYKKAFPERYNVLIEEFHYNEKLFDEQCELLGITSAFIERITNITKSKDIAKAFIFIEMFGYTFEEWCNYMYGATWFDEEKYKFHKRTIIKELTNGNSCNY